MERSKILERLGFSVGPYKKKRVIIVSDIKAEADDQFAITHHLLSPAEDVKGIVACHWETKFNKSPALAKYKGTSMQQSYDEGVKILDLMDIDDIPLMKGARFPLHSKAEIPESQGADLIIREAMADENTPLFIACQGALTDLAIAVLKKPEIISHLTAIVIAGGAYPKGGWEPNVESDLLAAQIVFDSGMNLWQIPMDVYGGSFVSLAEVVDKVKPCGAIGDYLYREMMEVNDFYAQVPFRMAWPHGETWSLGDNPTVTVLLQAESYQTWTERIAPRIKDDMTYEENPDGHRIRVYDRVDHRLGMDDFFSKLRLCYGRDGETL